MERTKVDVALKNVYEQVIALGHEPVVAIIVGSQNYRLDSPTSDIDCKVFIVPSLRDIVEMSEISMTIDTPYGQAEIKDIRLLPTLLRKANPTYLELLCGQFYTDSSEYMEIWLDIRNLLDEHVQVFRNRFINATVGSAAQYEKRALANTERDKLGYVDKPAYHIVRLYGILLGVLTQNKSFKQSLILSDKLKAMALSIKNLEIPKEESIPLLTQLMADIRQFDKMTDYSLDNVDMMIDLDKRTVVLIGKYISLAFST